MSKCDLQRLPVPANYGLMSDRHFVEARLESCESGSLRVCRDDRQNLAAFTALQQETFKVMPVSLLMPVGGGAESPFIGTDFWRGADLDHFLQLLLKLPRWEIARFCGLPNDERAGRVEQALRKHRLLFRRLPYHSRVIANFKDFEDFSRSRTHNFRNTLSKALKKIAKGDFGFTDSLEFEDWLKLYAKRHAKMSGDDYSVTGNFRLFFKKYREAARAEGRYLEVGFWQGTTLAAAGCAIRVGDVLYFYQTAHDPELGEYRPGLLMFYRLAEAALKQRPRLITFQSDADYLSHYTDQVLELVELEVFAPTIMGKALYAYRQLKKIQPIH